MAASIRRINACKHNDRALIVLPYGYVTWIAGKLRGGQCLIWVKNACIDREVYSLKNHDGQEHNPAADNLTRRRSTHGPNKALGDLRADVSDSWQESSDRRDRHGREVDVYASLLRRCGNAKALSWGKDTHTQIIRNGYERDRYLGNLLVQMYGKCGALQDAMDVFSKMQHRNVFSWTIMIGAYAQHGKGREALQLFQKMQMEGVAPNKVTFINILDACVGEAALAEGKRIHGRIVTNGFESDVVVGTALVNMYSKCGSLKDARRMFDKMSERNVITWNAMIAAYAQHGQGKEAFQLFKQMQLEGVQPTKITFISLLDACASLASLADGKEIHARVVSNAFDFDVTVGNALINMFGKCGSIEDAWKVFNKLPERNVISWTAMIAAYTQHGQGKRALELFQQMQLEGVIPDNVTYVSILDACATEAALAEGKQMHSHLVGIGLESDIFVGTALINMYGKCGSSADAERVFDQIRDRDMVSWNAMIAAYAQHGQGKDLLQLFQQMQLEGVMPNKVTFVSVLSACSHCGLVEYGFHCFITMIQDYSLVPTLEHFNCMIDLLGRTGWLDEGEKLINNMPFEPTVTSWLTLLGSCRMHFDVKRGNRCAEYVFQLDPENASAHVLLSNIFAAAGRWEHATEVRKNYAGQGPKEAVMLQPVGVKA